MGDNPKQTREVRITLDVILDRPLEATDLYVLRDHIVRTTEEAVPWVLEAHGVSIAPAEPDFDWQGK